jgi:hypothetical protein
VLAVMTVVSPKVATAAPMRLFIVVLPMRSDDVRGERMRGLDQPAGEWRSRADSRG